MTRSTKASIRTHPATRVREAANWAGKRSLRAGRPASPIERPRDLADVADGVTVRVGVFDIVLW